MRSRLCVSTLAAMLSVPVCAEEHHVSVQGNDRNNGSKEAPLRTISAAASIAQPGDVVTVHEGVYRERVNPPRGGSSDSKRITYRAAEGEKVVIKGSEIIKGWERVSGDVWKVTFPKNKFGDFNPFDDLRSGHWLNPKQRSSHTGEVYLNGHWLAEAAYLDDLFKPVDERTGPLWFANGPTRDLGNHFIDMRWFHVGSEKIEGVRFASAEGAAVKTFRDAGQGVGETRPGSWLHYRGIDFEGSERMTFNVSACLRGGIIELRLDARDGELIGKCAVHQTTYYTRPKFVDVATRIKPVRGKRDLFLVFVAEEFMEVPEDEDNTIVWAQFPDVDPNKEMVEINARRAVFYPEETGINYVTVSGFTLEQAAPNWAPPTTEQPAIIGTHWSKGWIIENNIVRYSSCVGITLGRYRDTDGKEAVGSASGYVDVIKEALAEKGWSKENIGGHIVRKNEIYHCSQAGIVGSLGAAFSQVTDNVIRDIFRRTQLFGGAEQAGLKFHGAIDTLIARNHFYRTTGIWLDWMTQGTRVSCNLFHDNLSDIFFEVNHGPYVVDNNLFLSQRPGIRNASQGGCFVHNLIMGENTRRPQPRVTPYHCAHSTAVAGFSRTWSSDDRFYNNLFVDHGLEDYADAKFPPFVNHNVYLNGAKPYPDEEDHSVSPAGAEFRITQEGEAFYLEMNLPEGVEIAKGRLITTGMLGKSKIAGLPYENYDGTVLKVDTDYFGNTRSTPPCAGPFENVGPGRTRLKVWPLDQ